VARSGPASRPQASNLGAGGAWDGVDDGPLVGTGEAGPGRSEWVFMRPGSPAADAVAGVGGGLGGRCGGGEPDPAAGEDVQGRVASPFGPFVVLLGQVGADQTGHGGETSSTGRDAGTSLKASVAGWSTGPGITASNAGACIGSLVVLLRAVAVEHVRIDLEVAETLPGDVGRPGNRTAGEHYGTS